MLLRVIQERYNLCTGAGILWREGCLCHAAGDAVGNSPHDRFIIPIGYLDIGKRILDSGLFLPFAFHMNVTISQREHVLLGLNVVAEVPEVIFLETAHMTAL